MEEYKTHPKYTRYEISNLGNVRNTKTGRILKQRKSSNGYLRINLREKRGVPITEQVHTLVADTWIGDRREGMQVDHVDRNRINNNVSNLRIVTASVNSKNKKYLKDKPHIIFDDHNFIVNGKQIDNLDTAIQEFKGLL